MIYRNSYSKRQIAVLFAILVSGLSLAIAQTDRRREADPLTIQNEVERTSSLLPQSTSVGKGSALESTIDPRYYFVGPSDIFAVSLWSMAPANYLLTVNPEGTIFLPTVGEISVADITLAEAKERIFAGIRRKYTGGEYSVALVSTRPLLVTVLGNVLNPGTYTLAAHNRVDRAIEEANRLLQGQDPDRRAGIISTMSRRDIQIRHKDLTLTRADIPRFRATREDRWNPYLREGDVVVVPRLEGRKQMIAVLGEVNAPDRFEYIDGDSLRGLLNMVFGFTRNARSDSIELHRQEADGAGQRSIILDGAAIARGTQSDIPLTPGDRVVVLRKLDSRADLRVSIMGEVLYPGTYPITRGTTKLSRIIAMAGGFTPEASLRSAQVTRRSVGPAEMNLERLESLRGGVSVEDSLYYLVETNIRLQKEVVNTDFEKLFVMGDSTQDVVLINEDNIFVPARPRTIYVFGQVVLPGHIPFAKGERYEYYLKQVGGATDRSRQGDIKIIKANTKQWLDPDDTEIEPGDLIWVPKEYEYPFSYYMGIIGQTASIVGVALSVVLLAVQLNK